MDRIAKLTEIASVLTDNGDIALKYAEHLNELLAVVDPQKINNDYAEAMASEDYVNACKALAAYYKAKHRNPVPELSADGEYNREAADRAIEGYAREVNIDWKFENGEIDFLFDPTAINGPRNHEWLWQFNRHGAWANMAKTFVGTGDEFYALGFERQLLKWIAQTYIPERWNGPGSAWRTIECGIRLLGTWPVSYDGFIRSDKINDITKLLLIASMHRQAKHLVDHPTGGNWLMMEMNGVYTFSALFPELTDSEEHRSIAANYLLVELEKQILPDGMHNELSPDYQSVVYSCASNFYNLAKSLGMASEIPEAFVTLIENTVQAAICLMTPAFTQPRTNDCFTIPTRRFTERTEHMLGRKPEYRFVNSKRAEGAAPKGETASRFLPYAGFVAMRSDWGPDATYMCFDVGPLGTNHIHQDKLNINIYKGSEELVFDDGGGQYEISEARKYALSGYGHNTMLVDGLAQSRKAPKECTEPIDAGWVTNSEFDYAGATYDDGFGADMVNLAKQKREVRFCKPDFFCVTDTVTSVDGKPHDYEILFHLDTTKVNAIPEYKNAIISDFGRKYDVVLIPLDCECAEPVLKTVSAATEPMMQGWYNGRNEANLHEAITVSREVKAVKDYRFTTLIFPIEKGQTLPKVTKNADGTVEVSFGGKEYRFNVNALNM